MCCMSIHIGSTISNNSFLPFVSSECSILLAQIMNSPLSVSLHSDCNHCVFASSPHSDPYDLTAMGRITKTGPFLAKGKLNDCLGPPSH